MFFHFAFIDVHLKLQVFTFSWDFSKFGLIVKHLLAFVLFLSVSSVFAGTTYYVSPEGKAKQDGTSWTTATTLKTALNHAIAGDQVWVKSGTYLVTSGTDRSKSFKLKAGVQLYGGFLGMEVNLNERQVDSRSTLSGDINKVGSDADNSYTILTLLSDTDNNSIVDGFVITGGTARNFKEGFTTGNTGGGIYIAATNERFPAHQINNCTITLNKGHNGAGVYLAGGDTSFDNCLFTHNVADFMGGAVYNQGAAGQANILFTNCSFENNGADYGGALANNGENGIANPLSLECTFRFNVARSNGSSVYNMTNETGDCSFISERCVFENNTSQLGNDIYTKGDKKSLSLRKQQSADAPVIITGSAKK